jgi:hypothetical protein
MPYTKVIVQRRNGSMVQGIRVALSISGVFSGGVTNSVLTDRHGVAIIEHQSIGEAKVLVNGTTKGKLRVPGETVIFI